jgi:hypothetical protein
MKKSVRALNRDAYIIITDGYYAGIMWVRTNGGGGYSGIWFRQNSWGGEREDIIETESRLVSL